MKNIRHQAEKWILPEPVDLNHIDLGTLSDPLKAILLRRGFDNSEKINEFFNPPLLPNPYRHFPELIKAISRLKKAITNKEKIAICGDYDADGMTSSALVNEVLLFLNANHEVFIPNRLEQGYGLNEDMIVDLNSRDFNLIVTVDNGVSATKAIKQATDLKIDVIITDHHKIPSDFSNVYALIHPENTPINSPYRFLAGVGLAYILCTSLLKEFNIDKETKSCLDLFCIGTIADMAPLKGANRSLLKLGLSKISSSESRAIKGLLKISKIKSETITSEDISFKIAPRINSIGRISKPDIIIKLFSETNEEKLNKLLEFVEQTNIRRKQMCNDTFKEALEKLENSYSNNDSFIVLVGNNWHPGLVGIVASRILDIYNRPVAVLTKSNSNLFTASARAPKGFNLIASLDKCSHLLEKYGGHKSAAGFSVLEENIIKLSQNLSEISSNSDSLHNYSNVEPEAFISFNRIDKNLLNQLENFQPFGIDNPELLFFTTQVKVRKIIYLGNSHMKLILEHLDTVLEAVHWNCRFNYKQYQIIDIAYNIQKNNFSNCDLQLNVKFTRQSSHKVGFNYNSNTYFCHKKDSKTIVIKNVKGDMITSDKKDELVNNLNCSYINRLFGYSQIALGIDP